ncbi:restriction endonuclease [Bacillus sp. AFS094228]|nr:restriction endonuclease [Bacillus sp. AFS094228]
MNERTPWLKEVIEALKELGGQGTLSDIYDVVQDRGNINLANYKDFRSPIRKAIYEHSSDADKIFTGVPGDETDIFYSVAGKGKGIWALRYFEPFGDNIELTEDDTGFVEGKKKLRQHIYRERNPKVILLAKKMFKNNNGGRLFCEICGFDFYDKYGEIGEDYIEGHHTIPVSELEEEQVTRVEDIAMVCSNCHRMLHRKRPWLNKEALKKLIQK